MDTPRQKVLIVDDSPANIRILGAALRNLYDMIAATRGEEALHLAAHQKPDLILLDIMMPDMDGYQVCQRLKHDPVTRNIPVIFVTARDDEQDETRGLELGAVDYIIKPFRLPIVKARIKTQLELKRHRDFLENLSSLDGLTGIPNRRRFNELLATAWRSCEVNAQPLSMCMIDIDLFKPYNDTYGHLAGDDCLRLVAHTLQAALPTAECSAARYGGEEFAVILPDLAGEEALAVAKDLNARVRALERVHERSAYGYVTISVGLATTHPREDVPETTLVDAADQMLYKAKALGRDQVCQIDLVAQHGA